MFRRFFCIFLNNIPTPSVYICECALPFFSRVLFFFDRFEIHRDIFRTYRSKVVPRKIFIHLFSAKNNKLTTRVWSLVVVPTPTLLPQSVCVLVLSPLVYPYLPLTQAATLVKHGQHKNRVAESKKLIFCTIEAKTHAVISY